MTTEPIDLTEVEPGVWAKPNDDDFWKFIAEFKAKGRRNRRRENVIKGIWALIFLAQAAVLAMQYAHFIPEPAGTIAFLITFVMRFGYSELMPKLIDKFIKY